MDTIKSETLLKEAFAGWLASCDGLDGMDRVETLFAAFRAGWKAAEDADLWGDE